MLLFPEKRPFDVVMVKREGPSAFEATKVKEDRAADRRVQKPKGGQRTKRNIRRK